jgi:hypothetical protein
MIIIVDQNKTKVTSFQTYWDVFHHIVEELEKPKQARDPLLPNWTFTIHPYQRALNFHKYMAETLETGIGGKSNRQGLSILEQCQGNVGKVSMLPVTPDLKIDDLKQEWCQNYLRAHGFFCLKADELPEFMKPW